MIKNKLIELIVTDLEIDPEKDIIAWSIITNENLEISLEGHLVKGGRNSHEKVKD